MCGVTGLFGSFDLERIDAMTACLSHRGPDEQGFFREPGSGLALGHRRLSIIDLAGGTQPIFNEDSSVVVLFNGEIYNYVELREDLRKRGHVFRTESDTETIVHLYEEMGDGFPQKLNGDFAIALYDRKLRKLFVVRDRLGIRPVYYATTKEGFLFGSEPKAIFRSGYLPKNIDRIALGDYLRLRYTPGPRTLFDGVRKLLPGHILEISADAPAFPKLTEWWNPDAIAPRARSDKSLVDEFDALLDDAVRIRMRSDVPVSAFLSGGLDSSLIVRLMARHGGVHRAYSIGFHLDIDENAQARSMAHSMGIDHSDIYVEPDGYRDLPRVAGRMDDPVGDIIILPTHTLAEHVSREGKVVLTGDGADEVWGGYLHHFVLHYLHGASRRAPGAINLGAGMARMAPLAALNALFPYPAALGEKGRGKLLKLLEQSQRPRDAYLSFTTFAGYEDVFRLLGDASRFPPVFRDLNDTSETILRRIFRAERRSWLPDCTLLKQDTLAMANSLEGRIPLLDHRIVEFAASLEDKAKIRMFRSKWLLRKIAERHLGKEIAWRKKKAFYIPTERCFDSGFARFHEEYFDEDRIRAEGVFDPAAFRSIVHQGGAEILDNKLRNNLLIFQMWRQAQFGSA